MHEMLHAKDINWADLEPRWKNGAFLIKGALGDWDLMENYEVTRNRDIIELLLKPQKD
jgi:hypothetical protein